MLHDNRAKEVPEDDSSDVESLSGEQGDPSAHEMELDTPTPRLSTPTFTPHEANDIDFRLGFMIDFFKRGSITDSVDGGSSENVSATPSAKATNGKQNDAAAAVLSTKKEKKRSAEESSEHLSNGVSTPEPRKTATDGPDTTSKSSKKSRSAESGEASSKTPKRAGPALLLSFFNLILYWKTDFFSLSSSFLQKAPPKTQLPGRKGNHTNTKSTNQQNKRNFQVFAGLFDSSPLPFRVLGWLRAG